MQHFHIIATNPNPLLQNSRGEQSARQTSLQDDEAPGTERQIIEDALLVDFVKRRKNRNK